jgi:hypothetical protein
MRFKTVCVFNAIVSNLFGISYVMFPGAITSLYGVELTPAGLNVTQMFGTALISLGFLTWFAKDIKEDNARHAIFMAMVVGYSVGFVVSLMNQLQGVVNPLGWSTVGIYLFLTAGWITIGLTGRGESEGVPSS